MRKYPAPFSLVFNKKSRIFLRKKVLLWLTEKVPFAPRKKRFYLPGKKMLCSHRKGYSPLYIIKVFASYTIA
tara:strand:- start:211 stop:426 length:216 start_codon:yes stop_codon:yes gene_type:complete